MFFLDFNYFSCEFKRKLEKTPDSLSQDTNGAEQQKYEYKSVAHYICDPLH